LADNYQHQSTLEEDPFNRLESFSDKKLESGEACTITKHLVSNEVSNSSSNNIEPDIKKSLKNRKNSLYYSGH
jgi:hypothetical protein